MTPGLTDRPLCFIAMPFGKKTDDSGLLLDFDAIYRDLIGPAVEAAGLAPIRADEELVGGLIHKPMFERLILCDFAVADLTTANANVYYELGVRHATRPFSTVLLFADGSRIPFDLGPIRAVPYRTTTGGVPAAPEEDRATITRLLVAARDAVTDSPVFQLVDDLDPPDVRRLKTDVFRERVEYSAETKERLARARGQGLEAVEAVKRALEPIRDREAGVVVDLFLSYRAHRGWDQMIALVEEMAEPVARSVLVREQLALALNRDGQGEEAERVLLRLLEERGPSSETLGILGRVYKDRWDEARQAERTALASGLLDKAIDAYLKGFRTDWRDAYPGINAATLMELRDPPDPRRAEILPVVVYGARRRVEDGEPDYWDYATLLEAAVLHRDRESASAALGQALATVREVWEPETTLRNLRLIREARDRRGETEPWMLEIEQELSVAAQG